MNRIYNPIVVLCAGFLFATTTTTTIMSNNSRMFLRCHAFVSNANKQYKLHSRGVNAWRLEYKNNYHLVVRGGGSGFFSSSENNKETRTTTTRLSSTTSPLRESSSVSESDEFEKRVLESISIASGGTRPTSIKSFGGLKYQDVSSSSDNNNKSSLFRVVFVLGGPGKRYLKQYTVKVIVPERILSKNKGQQLNVSNSPILYYALNLFSFVLHSNKCGRSWKGNPMRTAH